MARLLSCPHCRAQFSFDDWARGTSCPACAKPLNFFEASSQATPLTPPTVTPAPDPVATVVPETTVASPPAAADTAPETTVASPPAAANPAPAAASAMAPPAGVDSALTARPLAAAVAPSATFARDAPRRHTYTVGGKALEWDTAWTIVAVIWILVASGLVVTRVEMGNVTVMTPSETAAVAAVRQVKLPTGASTEAVLRYAATHDLTIEGHVAKIPPGGTQMWYAFDRPWEHRIYVYSQLPGTSMVGKGAVLSWTFSDGVARADAATRAALTKTAQTMAHPPSSKSVPAIPGVIPSLPADMQ
jgi:hypothetical protein